MGDNFLEGQAGNTKKRRAKAAAKLAAPKLLARPDVMLDEFTIDCQNNVSAKPGDMVICVANQNGGPIDVVIENRLLGRIELGGGEVLRNAIEHLGVGRLEILSHCSLTDTAKARLVQE